jgi:hypothetical protein
MGCVDLTSGSSVLPSCFTSIPAAPSAICVSGSTTFIYNNQLIYSISQLYAAGMMNNQFGIYMAYSNANVTSSAIWTASQSSTAQASYLAIQMDRNLVVYTVSGNTVLWSMGLWNGDSGNPFCLEMLNSGNLIWTDSTGTTIWQTNTAQAG